MAKTDLPNRCRQADCLCISCPFLLLLIFCTNLFVPSEYFTCTQTIHWTASTVTIALFSNCSNRLFKNGCRRDSSIYSSLYSNSIITFLIWPVRAGLDLHFLVWIAAIPQARGNLFLRKSLSASIQWIHPDLTDPVAFEMFSRNTRLITAINIVHLIII